MLCCVRPWLSPISCCTKRSQLTPACLIFEFGKGPVFSVCYCNAAPGYLDYYIPQKYQFTIDRNEVIFEQFTTDRLEAARSCLLDEKIGNLKYW